MALSARNPSREQMLSARQHVLSRMYTLCDAGVDGPRVEASTPTYPEVVNVFLAPSSITAYAGVVRVLTICVLIAGIAWVAPSYYWNEDTPTWLVPAAAIGASIPFIIVIASGPVITSIRLHIPRHARQSKADLMRFAQNIPPNAHLQVSFIRFMPWLSTHEMFFSELRRLHFKRRLANLQYIAADEEKRVAALGAWYRPLFKAVFCQYWVSMASKERSQVKGVWDEMYRQIPVVGSKEDVVRIEKKSIAVYGTSLRQQGRARVLPPGRDRSSGAGGVR